MLQLNYSTQNLQRRLVGSLILFATYAFVPQRQFILKNCLRNWNSFTYLQILPFHVKFYFSALNSSETVLIANLKLSFKI